MRLELGIQMARRLPRGGVGAGPLLRLMWLRFYRV